MIAAATTEATAIRQVVRDLETQQKGLGIGVLAGALFPRLALAYVASGEVETVALPAQPGPAP
jgi:hypothetical protein